MVQCQACQTENPPDAVYCVKCARKLDPETQARVVQVREAHTATGINWSAVIAAILVVLLVLVVLALFALHVI